MNRRIPDTEKAKLLAREAFKSFQGNLQLVGPHHRLSRVRLHSHNVSLVVRLQPSLQTLVRPLPSSL